GPVVVGFVVVVGVVVVVVLEDVVDVVVGGGGAVKWPTTIVTVLPFLALAPGRGLCEITIPSRDFLVTSCVCRVTVKPLACNALVACPALSPWTSGTCTFAGALATTIETVEPETSLDCAGGFWLMTVPGVALDEVVVLVLTLKPAFSSARVALSCDWPTTLGTVIFGLPVDTNSVTDVPTAGFCPAVGSLRIT